MLSILGFLPSVSAEPYEAEGSGGTASPSSPRAVLKRFRGAAPSVMRADCSPRPCSSFTWKAQCRHCPIVAQRPGGPTSLGGPNLETSYSMKSPQHWPPPAHGDLVPLETS